MEYHYKWDDIPFFTAVIVLNLKKDYLQLINRDIPRRDFTECLWGKDHYLEIFIYNFKAIEKKKKNKNRRNNMLKNYLQINRVIETRAWLRLINLFVPNAPFPYPLKTAENCFKLSYVFRKQRKGALGWNGLTVFIFNFGKRRNLVVCYGGSSGGSRMIKCFSLSTQTSGIWTYQRKKNLAILN